MDEDNFFDEVERPEHYASGNIECLEAIKSSMSDLEFAGFLKGQIIKYIWRYDKKGHPITDLKKARFYLARLIYEMEEEHDWDS